MNKNILIILGLILVSCQISANPNFAISIGMKQDQDGKLIQPDRIYMSKAIKAYNKKANGDAFNYFLKAAALGNTLSQRYIGLMYINGIGVKKDMVIGYAWLKLAKKDNSEKNIALEKQVAKLLTAQQLQQAEKEYQKVKQSYGSIAALKRRNRWVQKQKMKMTGSHTGSMAFAPIAFDRPHGGGFYNSVQAYVDDYNYGYVKTGEIIAKDEEDAKNDVQDDRQEQNSESETKQKKN